MKFSNIVVLGTILAACAPAALADRLYGEIDTAGKDTISQSGNTVTVAFGTTVTQAHSGTVNGDGQYDLSNVTDATLVTYAASFTFNATTGALATDPVLLYSITEGGDTLKFYLTGIVDDTVSATGKKGAFDATGYITETGNPNETAVTFSLTNSSTGSGSKSFSSALIAPTPEPGGLALLGTGMVSAAGMMFRRRRAV